MCVSVANSFFGFLEEAGLVGLGQDVQAAVLDMGFRYYFMNIPCYSRELPVFAIMLLDRFVMYWVPRIYYCQAG